MLFYLKPTSWSPKGEFFYAIKTGGEFHPCTYQRDYNDQTTKFEAFVRGKGWKTSKNGHKIPVYTGTTTQEMQEYIDQYGAPCLFYSITGKEINSGDCVVWAAQQEFKVALSVGLDYVAGFVKRINDLNAKIRQIVMDKYGVDVLLDKIQTTKQGQCIGSYDLFYVKPSYSVMAYFLTKPNLDVIRDDERLWKHYVAVNGHKHVNENEGEFPVQMKARLEFLFGKEVSLEYEALMKEYPMT